MSRIKVFLSAILAGMCVSFGGLVFLMLDSKIVGAALFTIGLFVIPCMGFILPTASFKLTFIILISFHSFKKRFAEFLFRTLILRKSKEFFSVLVTPAVNDNGLSVVVAHVKVAVIAVY